jgi:hypothetical protein
VFLASVLGYFYVIGCVFDCIFICFGFNILFISGLLLFLYFIILYLVFLWVEFFVSRLLLYNYFCLLMFYYFCLFRFLYFVSRVVVFFYLGDFLSILYCLFRDCFLFYFLGVVFVSDLCFSVCCYNFSVVMFLLASQFSIFVCFVSKFYSFVSKLSVFD